MMTKFVCALASLLFLSEVSIAQKMCDSMIVRYEVDTLKPLKWYERASDSLSKLDDKFRLDIGEDIHGIFKLYFNDSLFFSGKISADPTQGYAPSIVLNNTQVNNVLRLESQGKHVDIHIDRFYRHIIIGYFHKCGLWVKFSNRQPFRG